MIDLFGTGCHEHDDDEQGHPVTAFDYPVESLERVEDDTDDIAQEVFIRFFNRRGTRLLNVTCFLFSAHKFLSLRHFINEKES